MNSGRLQGMILRSRGVFMGAALLVAGLLKGADQQPAENAPKPRTYREMQELKNPPPGPPKPIVVENTRRAALGYPRVFVRLFNAGRVMVGEPASGQVQRARVVAGDWQDLNLNESFGPQTWWTAILDTGAGMYSLNQETSGRFNLKGVPTQLLSVNGVDGHTFKYISSGYTLNLAPSNGMLVDKPEQPFIFVQDGARFSIEVTPFVPTYKILPEGVNVIGMPAIRRFVVEFDPTNMDTNVLSKALDPKDVAAFDQSLTNVVAGPRIRFYPPDYRPTNDVVRLPLRYINYNFLRSVNNGPVPDFFATPMLMGVKTTHQGREFVGNFLFDSGASFTIISRWQAYQLGLIPSSNPVFDRPEYHETVRGAAGREVGAPGFSIDTLQVRSPDGQIIEWRNANILVHDVWVVQPDGSRVIRDGIIGNNLFLPSTNGEITENGLDVAPAPFPKFWIHGPMAELWIQKPVVAETNAK